MLMVHPRLDASDEEVLAPGEKAVIVKVHDDVPVQVSKASFVDKLRDVPPLLKYIVPLTMVYLFEYFINQGLVRKKKTRQELLSVILYAINLLPKFLFFPNSLN